MHTPRLPCCALRLWLPLLACLGACVTTPRHHNHGAILLSNSTPFALLPPRHIEKPMDMLQRISGSHKGNHWAMNAWVKANEEGLVMELLGDMGNSLGTLVYDGEGVRFSSSVLPPHLKPEYVLADFQLCFFRPEALRPALGKLILQTDRHDGVEVRRLYEGDACLVEIEKTPQAVHYKNHLRGYAYSIEGAFEGTLEGTLEGALP